MLKMSIIEHRSTSYWLDGLPESRTVAPVPVQSMDVVIVGGGLSGLSTAYNLIKMQPSLKILLLEASCVGWGASGRSTGMLSPGMGGSIVRLVHKLGAEKARKIYLGSLYAVQYALNLIQTENWDCDLEITSQIKAARTIGQSRTLAEQSKTFDQLGFDVPYLDKGAISKLLPSFSYTSGLLYSPTGLINPAKLCLAMKQAIEARGVIVCEATEVRAVTPGNPNCVHLVGGKDVLADRLILTINAYLPRLGFLQGEIIPIYSHVIVTQELSRSQLSRLGWEGRQAIAESNNFFSYYRLTKDNRLMFGGGKPLYQGNRTDAFSAVSIEELRQELKRLSTVLSNVKVVASWSGSMGFTLDNFPIVGRVEGSVPMFLSGGCNGHGIAFSIANGATLAQLVLDDSTAMRDTPWIRNHAPRLPPDPLRNFLVKNYMRLLCIEDWLERFKDMAARFFSE